VRTGKMIHETLVVTSTASVASADNTKAIDGHWC
jgi:hypothetical protein